MSSIEYERSIPNPEKDPLYQAGHLSNVTIIDMDYNDPSLRSSMDHILQHIETSTLVVFRINNIDVTQESGNQNDGRIVRMFHNGHETKEAIELLLNENPPSEKSDINHELLNQLTRREKELFALLAAGAYYKEIAQQLNISIDTVKKHLNNIYKKLGVHNRTDAINKVYRTRMPS